MQGLEYLAGEPESEGSEQLNLLDPCTAHPQCKLEALNSDIVEMHQLRILKAGQVAHHHA